MQGRKRGATLLWRTVCGQALGNATESIAQQKPEEACFSWGGRKPGAEDLLDLQ